jgi:hypothetical protein
MGTSFAAVYADIHLKPGAIPRIQATRQEGRDFVDSS